MPQDLKAMFMMKQSVEEIQVTILTLGYMIYNTAVIKRLQELQTRIGKKMLHRLTDLEYQRLEQKNLLEI